VTVGVEEAGLTDEVVDIERTALRRAVLVLDSEIYLIAVDVADKVVEAEALC
jgi:hypothetical protein